MEIKDIMENVLQAINRNPRLSIWTAGLAMLVVLGAYGLLMSLLISMELFEFHHAVPWTMKISTYIFFVASSTGICMITSLGHVFGAKRFDIIGKRGAFLALITVTFGMTAILLHLGHPERSFFFYLTPNIRSAIWGMSLFYTIAIPFIMIEYWFMSRADWAKIANESTGYKQLIYSILVLGQRDESNEAEERDHKWAKIAAVIALIFELAAFSTLGSIFGHTQAKAYWHGSYFPLFFLLSAGYSGLSWLIGMIIATYYIQKKEMSEALRKLVFEMGNILAVLLAVGLLFTVFKISSNLLDPVKAKTVLLLTRGPFIILFWVFEITIGLVLPLVLLIYSLKSKWSGGLFVSSVMVLIGIFFMRYNFLVAGQMYPYFEKVQLPESVLPTVIETFVVAGIFGALFLIYTYAVKFLALDEKAH